MFSFGVLRVTGGMAIAMALVGGVGAADLQERRFITCEPLEGNHVRAFRIECKAPGSVPELDQSCACPEGFVPVIDVAPAAAPPFPIPPTPASPS